MASSPNQLNNPRNQLFCAIEPQTPIQKRAISYANTIAKLFDQVFDTNLPADRILANYFREHKKHGSKDRRVIRETFFALFRWWGWLQQLPSQMNDNNTTRIDYQKLAASALLEQHGWQDVIQAWIECANLETQVDIFEISSATNNPQQKSKLMAFLASEINFKTSALLPEWFWQVCHVPAEQQSKLVESMVTRPPIWARTQNIDREHALEEIQANGIDAQASEYFADALSLGTKSINLDSISLYKQGHIEIQDLASQVIGQVCAPKPNEQWWDACSGAGGKTLQLKSAMLREDINAQGTITSSDIRPRVLEELKKRAKRAGYTGISTTPWKSEELPVAKLSFDGVLVDAPCSCIGTWRRNADMRWVDNIDSVQQKSALQLDILSRSSQAVKVGGRLIYATCSLAEQENEAVVRDFVSRHPEFKLQTIQHPFTGKQSDMLTIWPFEADSDGMFVAKFIRMA